MLKRHVGIVIPARNEERHLPRVLDTVCAVGWLKEIVVIDDNSSDSTLEIAENYAHQDERLSAIHLKSNQGKSRALLTGVSALHDRIEDVIFLDADLIGMRINHIQDLYEPVGSNRSQMAVAVFRSGGLRTTAAHIATPYLSGQRCMRRSAAHRVLKLLENSGYGVEIGLTLYARRNIWDVLYVPWKGVTHYIKEDKLGFIGGVQKRSVMYAQVIATWMQYRKDEQWLEPRITPRGELEDHAI